jgi:hypothetical protein
MDLHLRKEKKLAIKLSHLVEIENPGFGSLSGPYS